MRVWFVVCLWLLPALAWAPPYKVESPSTATRACVQVWWTATEEENIARCGGQGCFYEGVEGSPGLIIAPRPHSFNDHRRLLILGHEFYHSLGASHD